MNAVNTGNQTQAQMTTNFGALDVVNGAVFRVETDEESGDVVISQHYGGGESDRLDVRCVLPERAWVGVRDAALEDFRGRMKMAASDCTARLGKVAGQPGRERDAARLRNDIESLSGNGDPIAWADKNVLDRMLGKELCVLVWAAEHASSDEELETISRRWSELTPAERWWMFNHTIAERGLAHQGGGGWRLGIYYLLSCPGTGKHTCH